MLEGKTHRIESRRHRLDSCVVYADGKQGRGSTLRPQMAGTTTVDRVTFFTGLPTDREPTMKLKKETLQVHNVEDWTQEEQKYKGDWPGTKMKVKDRKETGY